MSFHKNNRSGGKKFAKKSFGERSFGDSRPAMHRAICAECNKECEVPFKPHGDKPVFCRNCFKNREDSSPRESGGREFVKRDSGARDFGAKNAGGGITKEQFEILNSKLDRILDAVS